MKNFVDLVAATIPEHARGKPIELWRQNSRAQVTHDRRGQQGTLTRLWPERGSRPAAPRDRRYAWTYLFGASCPARSIGGALVLPCVNTSAMNLHLAGISRHVTPGIHAVITIDSAGWHYPGGP